MNGNRPPAPEEFRLVVQEKLEALGVNVLLNDTIPFNEVRGRPHRRSR
jgi:hypothetical protein